MIDYDSLFIGGNWVAPSSTNRITAIAASTEEVIGWTPEAQEADVDAAVVAARRAFLDPAGWAHWSPADRATAMERLADILERRAEEIVQRVSAQNGMPVAVARQLEGSFPGRVAPLLRRARVGIEFRGDPTGALRRKHPGTQGTTRRRRRDRAVELPANPGGIQVCARAGGRVHADHQAIARNSPGLLRFRRGGGGSRTSARRDQRGPRRDATSARISSHTRVSTRSPSPVRRQPAGPSAKYAASCSSPSRSNWAASRRPSCLTTPTSIWRPSVRSSSPPPC